jgi:hypothetical protein
MVCAESRGDGLGRADRVAVGEEAAEVAPGDGPDAGSRAGAVQALATISSAKTPPRQGLTRPA